jgi:hypothetical protein
MLYLYAWLNFAPQEWSYIEWRTTHTNPCFPFRHRDKDARAALWRRVNSGRSTLPAAATRVLAATSSSDQPMARALAANEKAPPRSDELRPGDGTYEGARVNGVPSGHGTVRYPDGSAFAGQWLDGKRHGQGVEEDLHKGTVYDGQWEGDLKHGRGSSRLTSSGARYEGEFASGKKEGCTHSTGSACAIPSVAQSKGQSPSSLTSQARARGAAPIGLGLGRFAGTALARLPRARCT